MVLIAKPLIGYLLTSITSNIDIHIKREGDRGRHWHAVSWILQDLLQPFPGPTSGVVADVTNWAAFEICTTSDYVYTLKDTCITETSE